MRRLGSSFLTLWGAFFVPSAIIWGLMLRWSVEAAARVETIWRWTADRLAFPLLLDRQIEWSWRVIADGSPWQATGGFVFLTALWALMFALPLAIFGAWWVWLTTRAGGRRALVTSDAASAGTLALSASPSPMGALHLITVPIALLYYATRAVVSVLRPALWTFIVCWIVALGIVVIWFSQVDPWRWGDAFASVRRDGWEGYLDALHIPRLFNDEWYARWNALWTRQHSANLDDRLGDPGDWYRYSDLWILMMLHAARHALAPALVVAVWSTLASVFTRGRGAT